MSHETVILAKVPLPERPAGWRGYFGPAPLWYAAVDLFVGPWDAASGPHADWVAAQGGCAQVLRLSYRSGAADLAEGYADVLRAATGGTQLINGVHFGTIEPRPTTLEALEAALFEQDLAGLEADPPVESRDQLMDEELYRRAYGRPRPRFAQDVSLVYLVPDAPAPVKGVRVESLRAWVGGEPNLLGVAAQLARDGGPLRRFRSVVTVLQSADLSREEESTLERFIDALIDRHRARELELPKGWRHPYPDSVW